MLISNSLLPGTYPSAWQEAKVKPLQKKEYVNSVKDLRPIFIYIKNLDQVSNYIDLVFLRINRASEWDKAPQLLY